MSKTSKPVPPIPAKDTFSRAHARWQANPVSRRRFIQGMAALSAGLLAPSLPGWAALKNSGTSEADKEPWHTLAAVQNHLFPSEADSPGAREINATSYLRDYLAEEDTDAEERDFILSGPAWLNDLALKQYHKRFPKLDESQREELLRRISRSNAGENWLSLLLLYIFEALLSAPVYGGNPNGIGWRWLQHQPGFPQPDAAHTYQQLKRR